MQTSFTVTRGHGAGIHRHGELPADGLMQAVRMVSGSIMRIVRRARAERQLRREYAVLMTMPDYLLSDLGLTRDQVAEAQSRHRPLWKAGL